MILVIGATGNVGRQVVSQLLERGVAVRALTRDPAAADLPSGVEVVAGDLSDPSALERHAEGVDAVFLVWPFTSPEQADELAPAVLEAIAPHARRVVYLSATPAAYEPDSFWARVEQAIERSDAGWTFLGPSGFAANTRMWAEQIRSDGVVHWPYGEAARSLIHERDIAAVAVRALTEEGHGGQAYHLTGPETITQAQQVHAIGEAIGRPLRWEELSREAALEQLTDAFGDAPFAEGALITWAGCVDHPEEVTSTVEELTCAPARSFDEWARDHADDFR